MQQINGKKSNNSKRVTQAIGLFIFVLLLFSACTKSTERTQLNLSPTPSQGAEGIAGEFHTTQVKPTESIFNFELGEKIELYYYTVNPDSLETEAVSTVVDKDFANEPEELLILVSDSLSDAGYDVAIDSAELNGNLIIVNFEPGTHPVSGLSEQEEKAVLDAIAQSLLDNIAEQNSVVFRVIGGPYQSDNFSFGMDYVYMKNERK